MVIIMITPHIIVVNPGPCSFLFAGRCFLHTCQRLSYSFFLYFWRQVKVAASHLYTSFILVFPWLASRLNKDLPCSYFYCSVFKWKTKHHTDLCILSAVIRRMVLDSPVMPLSLASSDSIAYTCTPSSIFFLPSFLPLSL